MESSFLALIIFSLIVGACITYWKHGGDMNDATSIVMAYAIGTPFYAFALWVILGFSYWVADFLTF